jgi:hypothetical protein
MGKHTQTNKQEKKNSRFRNNRISLLVILVLVLQHPVLVWYLSRSSVLLLPGVWGISPVLFIFFSHIPEADA